MSRTLFVLIRKHLPTAVAVYAAFEAFHRRAVGCGNDQHGLFPPFRAKVVLNELTHFAAALANQRQHAHIGGTALMMLDKSVLYRRQPPRKIPMRCPRRR